MDNNELEFVNLGFTRDEELSSEKLSAFERALDHSYGLYRSGLLVTDKTFEGVPNKHIKVSLATAVSAAAMVLDSMEKHGGVIVMDREVSAGMLLPWLLAGCELLNTVKEADNG